LPSPVGPRKTGQSLPGRDREVFLAACCSPGKATVVPRTRTMTHIVRGRIITVRERIMKRPGKELHIFAVYMKHTGCSVYSCLEAPW
jgi:hypothetical protein